MKSSETERKNKSKNWFYGGSGFLLLLALFWSVDSIVIYVCLAGALFCFSQYILHTLQERPTPERTDSPKPEMSGSKRIEEVLDDIQRGFGTKSTLHTSAVKVVFRIVAMFLGLFFILSVIGILFMDDDYVFSDSYYRAQEFISTEAYDSALYYLQLAARESPSNPEVFIERGNVFIYMNRYDSALAQLDKALVLDNRHSEARYLKVYSLFQLTQYRETIKEGVRLAKQEPENLGVMLLVGDSYYLQNRYDSALFWYTTAYDGGARSSALSNVMAYINDTNGQIPTAIEFYKEAIGLDSTLFDAYDRLGELLPGEEGNRYRTEAIRVKRGL